MRRLPARPTTVRALRVEHVDLRFRQQLRVLARVPIRLRAHTEWLNVLRLPPEHHLHGVEARVARVDDQDLVVLGVVVEHGVKAVLRHKIAKVLPQGLALSPLNVLEQQRVVRIATQRWRDRLRILCGDEHEQTVVTSSDEELHNFLVVLKALVGDDVVEQDKERCNLVLFGVGQDGVVQNVLLALKDRAQECGVVLRKDVLFRDVILPELI